MSGRPVVSSLVVAASLLLLLNTAPAAIYAVENPELYVQIHSDCAVAYGFQPGWVHWQLRDAPGGELLYDDYLAQDDSGALDFCWLNGATYEPGGEVTASDGVSTKVLLLLDLTIDVNDDADVVMGTAPAGTSVDVNLWDNSGGGANQRVDAVDGTWLADFSGIYDIDTSTGAAARVADDDGDRTEVDWRWPTFEVAMTPELSMPGDTIFTCCGEGWMRDASVTVQVFKGQGGASLFGPYSVANDEEGGFAVWPDELELDLLAGMYVVVTGNQTGFAKDLTLADISLDLLDAETDTASGKAPAGSWLWVEAGVPNTDNAIGFGGVQADESGLWFADFGAQGFDITPEMGGAVHLADGDGDTTRAGIPGYEPPQLPAIDANLAWDSVGGYDFPPGATATLTIMDPDGIVLVGPLDKSVTDEGDVWFEAGADFDLDLVPGMEVTLADGTSTKVLYLEPLTFDLLDPDTDTATGTASPGTRVFVDLWESEGEGGGYAEVDADGSGNWTATAPDFDPPLDITPTMDGQAGVYDEDGDRTTAGWQRPEPPQVPTLEANLTWDWVAGRDFSGDTATLTISDSDTGTVLLGPVDATLNDEGEFWFELGEYDFYLLPGMEVMLGDSTTAKSLFVEPITFDVLDADNDIAAGTAGDGVTVFVDLWESEGEGGGYAEVTAEGGLWTASGADFDPPLDITPTIDGQAAIYDEDGDRTSAGWQRPEPPQLPTIEANLTWNSVNGHGFSAGAVATFTIADGDTGSPLLGPVVRIIDEDGEVWIELGEYDFELLPGMEVTVTDGTTTKMLLVEPLTFDALNAIANTVSGSAPAGAIVEMDLWDGEGGYGEVTADDSGKWTADTMAFDPPFDITPWLRPGPAFISDADGDWTTAHWALPHFEVGITTEASMPADFIFMCCGEGWPADDSVSVQVFDAPGGASLFGPYSVPTDPDGSFYVGAEEHGLDLLPGMYVVVTGETTGIPKELVLHEASFDVLHADTDTASGTAPAGSEVFVEVVTVDGEGWSLYTHADANGNWFADFDAEGFDITPDMGGGIQVADEDGDTTRAGIAVPVGPQYEFSGFFRPVDNRPTVNLVKAGQAIPLKFSLGGDFGLDVLVPGSPSVGAFACGSPDLDPIEWTASASDAGLRYDFATGQYIFVWKTSEAWAGTCQRLTFEFNDGSVQTADFKFTR